MEPSKVGYKLTGVLSFVGRPLPKSAQCGVCHLYWDITEYPATCMHCRSNRIAQWQWVKGGIIQPGALLVPSIDGEGLKDKLRRIEFAIVTSIQRIQRIVHIVAFLDCAVFPIKISINQIEIASFKILEEEDSRAARFFNFALCPHCDTIFRLQNWDLQLAESRDKVVTARRNHISELGRVSVERKRLQAVAPYNYEAILKKTADIKRLRRELEFLSRRQCPPQLWCPKCLCSNFPLS